ncbi:hypothetical protein KM043_003389 [Ampulex compressa]|nr:hypothetical protein KM043_003389 [Ampulex compressa]
MSVSSSSVGHRATEKAAGMESPVKGMPDCWEQDERMNALFSPFRSKAANPQDWNSKLKFWRKAIYDHLRYAADFTFSVAELNEVFKRKGCAPLCLATVIEELVRNDEIVRETDFYQDPRKSWSAWTIDVLIKKPVTWTLFRIRNYIIGQSINDQTRYVHMRIVKETANVVLSALRERRENLLLSLTELTLYCKSNLGENISDHTMMLVLTWLEHTRKVIVSRVACCTGDEPLVKISTGDADQISKVEEGLYRLAKQENDIVHEIERLEQEKVNVLEEARAHLAKGLRQMAKTRVGKKIELERAIEKRIGILENLRALISAIQDAHTSCAVLAAYKTGSDVLRKMEGDGTNKINAANIIDDIANILQEQEEVRSTLSEPFIGAESDADLERELAELISADDGIEVGTKEDLRTDMAVAELEKRLIDLRVQDSKVPAESSTPSLVSDIREVGKKARGGVQYA